MSDNLSKRNLTRNAWVPVRRIWAKKDRLWRFGIQALVFFFFTWIAIGHPGAGGGPMGFSIVPAVHAVAKKGLDADNIQGTWTLDELVRKSGISKKTFAEKLGFSTKTSGDKKLRDIAQILGKHVEHFRKVARQRAYVPKMPGLHAEQIRGYWSLHELILKSGISKETFAKKIGFSPDTPENKQIKDIVQPMGKEVEEFRKVLKEEGQKKR